MKFKIINALFIICVIFSSYVTVFTQPDPNDPPFQVSGETRDLITGKTDFQYKINVTGRLALINRWASILYRNPTKKELALVAVSSEYLSRYKVFVKNENSGIIRLLPNSECLDSSREISANNVCNSMPGNGANYSFRTKNYRIPRLADLIYTDNSFQSPGVLLHGIFVNIGDIPLEDVKLQTKGLEFLRSFKPETNYEKAKSIAQKLVKGVQSDGFVYGRRLRAVEGNTYILRSIAYGGEYFRAINDISYNELDFDKRLDIIIAFRFVGKADDGSAIILWKELDRKKSPRIKE